MPELTVDEVAAETGLHIDTIRRYCRQKKIKARLVGGLVYMIPRPEVRKIKAMMEAPGFRAGRPRRADPPAAKETS